MCFIKNAPLPLPWSASFILYTVEEQYKLQAQASQDHGVLDSIPVFFIVSPEQGDDHSMLQIHCGAIIRGKSLTFPADRTTPQSLKRHCRIESTPLWQRLDVN